MTIITQKEPPAWNVVEKFLRNAPPPYYITCLLISILFIVIYQLLSQKVAHFNWGYNKFDSIKNLFTDNYYKYSQQIRKFISAVKHFSAFIEKEKTAKEE